MDEEGCREEGDDMTPMSWRSRKKEGREVGRKSARIDEVAASSSKRGSLGEQQRCAASGERARGASKAERARRGRGVLGKEGVRVDKDDESGGLD
jgi:hypothetical protein